MRPATHREPEGAGAPASAGRDPILDLWRGLALVDMVLVHVAWNEIGLPEPLDTIVKHYTRFAAGGFVLIAGLTVGTVFGPRTRGPWRARLETYRWLWRRALLLIVVDRLASVAMVALGRWRPFGGGAESTAAWLDVLLFRAPGVTGGLLALYTLLLSATPLLFEGMRRIGPVPVAAMSLAAYAAVDRAGGPWHWPPWSFPLASWQPVYVAGLAAAPLVPWLRAGGPRRLRLWLVASLVAFVPIFLARFGADFGLAAFTERLALDFTKVPLRPGGLLWYLAASQLVLAGSLAAWERLPSIRPGLAWLATLGRNSLPVYVAHLFTEVPVVDVVWAAWPPAAVRVLLVALDVAALVALARWVERGRSPAPRARPTRVPPVWIPRPAWAVGVAVVASALALAAVRSSVALAPSVAAITPPAAEEGAPVELVDVPSEEPVVDLVPGTERDTPESQPI